MAPRFRPPQKSGKFGGRHPGFVQQMTQSRLHPRLGPTDVRPIVFLEQSAEQVEVVLPRNVKWTDLTP